MNSNTATGDKNKYVVVPAADHVRDMHNPQGYICPGCGGWIPYNFSHQCPGYMKVTTQAQATTWPTVEWLTLQELKRIANALEKIAGIQSSDARPAIAEATPGTPGASQCQNEKQSSAKASPSCSQS